MAGGSLFFDSLHGVVKGCKDRPFQDVIVKIMPVA